MMKCSVCGAELAEADKFCGDCGAPVPAATPSPPPPPPGYEAVPPPPPLRAEPPPPPPPAGEIRQPERQVRPAPPPPPAGQPRPERKQGRRGWLAALVLLAGLCVLLVLAGLVFRQPLSDALVNFGLEQGWGTVNIDSTPIAGNPPVVQLAPPAQEDAAPTQAITAQATMPYQKGRVRPADPSLGRIVLPLTGVAVAIPPGLTAEVVDEFYVYFDGGPETGMDMMCDPAEQGGFIQELEWWLEFQDGVNWEEPILIDTAIGPAGWSTGLNSKGNPVFGAVAGPTRTKSVIHFWGLGPDEGWADLVEDYKMIVGSMEYSLEE